MKKLSFRMFLLAYLLTQMSLKTIYSSSEPLDDENTSGDNCILGENECMYEKETVCYWMKNETSRHCQFSKKNCNDPDFPLLECEENRCEITKRGVPQKYTKYRLTIECCPGWDRYDGFNLGDGCLKHISCITLPQYTPKPCRRERQKKLKINRNIYRLTKPLKTVQVAQVTEANLLDCLVFPLLNLSLGQVTNLTFADPNESKWARVYIDMAERNRKLVKEVGKERKFDVLHSFSNYSALLDYYRKRQHTGGSFDQYFRFPSQEEDFKDIITSEVWQDDKVFTEQRLAGLNPMSLRKLTLQEYTVKHWRFSPALNSAINRVTCQKTNMLEMVGKELVYIVDYPLIHSLTNVPDILDLNSSDSREMRSSRSPLAVFLSVQNCSSTSKKYELKPVAIQTDFTASSPVFTPADGSKWLLAKEEVQRADITHVEMIEHLLKTHLMMEPICVTIKRTISEHHPLYELFRWHCRGTFMTNSLGLPSLIKPQGFMHLLFAIGHIGAIELLNKGYPHMSWADTDFKASLKKRGVDNTEKLPYFPYRDDGIIIWRRIRAFAKEYVNLYYHNREFIENDNELQNFANELSDKGVGPNGGLGMVKGFPSIITTKRQLIDTLARIIFLPVQHQAINYPVAYYSGFVPNMPAKLYDDSRVPPDEFAVLTLPESHITSIQVALAMNLGSLRFDKLFDYGSELKDRKAARVVRKYYRHLMGQTLSKLKLRNKQRLHAGYLTYPYFLPGWMPNSIQT